MAVIIYYLPLLAVWFSKVALRALAAATPSRTAACAMLVLTYGLYTLPYRWMADRVKVAVSGLHGCSESAAPDAYAVP